MLRKKYNRNRRRREYALVSIKNPDKVLYWFGTRKPSKEKYVAQERRVQFFKNVSAHMRVGKRKPHWVKKHWRRV